MDVDKRVVKKELGLLFRVSAATGLECYLIKAFSMALALHTLALDIIQVIYTIPEEKILENQDQVCTINNPSLCRGCKHSCSTPISDVY